MSRCPLTLHLELDTSVGDSEPEEEDNLSGGGQLASEGHARESTTDNRTEMSQTSWYSFTSAAKSKVCL